MIELKPFELEDYAFGASVYNYYIKNTTSTFHTDEITADEFQSSITFHHPKFQSFIIQHKHQPIGYCYFAPFKPRKAYDISAEVTIYLHSDFTQQGFGPEVLQQMISIARKVKLQNLMAVITAENQSSIRLFKRHHFEQVGLLKNIGVKFKRTLDVAILQLELGK